ncbi:hypothetical protein ATSB10_02520 [Dyella thiooxydans]|uniref:Uncharacterized protein n=1 Tax=Dyella thiooxydans TaxID=445710 RepID=A0A160MX57_9GAMM|nr:hypothetical protein [Dyella thiooxydans]AND67706.1 hypothetical protein ATSB10_02520 [Dyella thiooxydans]
MAQTIDPIRLKSAAEHLEWALKQYPDSADVQSLLRALTPLLDDAKAGRVLEPVDRWDIPGTYNFADGRYIDFSDPSVDGAFVRFSIEMRGGLTEQEKRIHARMDAMRAMANENGKS